MNGVLVLAAIGTVALFVLTELTVAVLPLIVVVTMVPPEQRHDLAEILAAADSRRRLRLWRAARVAVKARRAESSGQSR